MADYIDRQAVINALLEELAYKPEGFWDSGLNFYDVEVVLNQQPAVDAVEVVRCKDCRWWDEFPNNTASPEYHTCKRPFVQLSMAAWDYCSKGVRKDG